MLKRTKRAKRTSLQGAAGPDRHTITPAARNPTQPRTRARAPTAPPAHARRSVAEWQAGEQGLVGVKVFVTDACPGVVAAVAATPDAARRNGGP